MPGVAVLGATGSIGRAALEVIARNPEVLSLVAISYHSNDKLAAKIKAEFGLTKVICTKHEELDAILEDDSIEIVVIGVPGFVGLKAVISCLGAGKHLAVANKEAFVTAGEIVLELARQKGVYVVPVDSEHNAAWQCIQDKSREVSEMILTASGGPLLHVDDPEPPMEKVLAHPTWNMGKKITVDSATMMNKVLELIEARVLFNPPKLSVLVHPQSIVHSLVRFSDGNMLAGLSPTTMSAPFSYSFDYLAQKLCGKRILPPFEPLALTSLEFLEPDTKRFPALNLAKEVLQLSRSSAVVLNAANEEAVNAYLSSKLPFSQIVPTVEKALSEHTPEEVLTIDKVVEIDTETRKRCLT